MTSPVARPPRLSPRVIFILGVLAVTVIAAALLWFSRTQPRAIPDTLSFDELPGWPGDDWQGAQQALIRSCQALGQVPPSSPLGSLEQAGVAGDWAEGCAAVTAAEGAAAFVAAVEAHFSPVAVQRTGDPPGLFTGYYEPILQGRLEAGGAYKTPLYARPDDLVMVDLAAFRPDLAGRRIAGRVVGGRLLPYPSRAEIDAGALEGYAVPIVYVDDPVAAFILHIQGSGQVALPGGETIRVGYAAQNGHPYKAIGSVLVQRGELALEDVTMPAILDWMTNNPDQASDLMAANRSYIFFRRLEGEDGPIGASNLPLTPGHSLAVDRRHVPLHVPLYVLTSLPNPAGGDPRPFQRIMVAQDTGGAITGAVRGDVFLGAGDEAGRIAGLMKQPGRYFMLLPNHALAKASEALDRGA